MHFFNYKSLDKSFLANLLKFRRKWKSFISIIHIKPFTPQQVDEEVFGIIINKSTNLSTLRTHDLNSNRRLGINIATPNQGLLNFTDLAYVIIRGRLKSTI